MKEAKKMRKSKYTKEFRDKTVQLILNIEKSAMQIAKDLGEKIKQFIIGLKFIKKRTI